MDAGFVAGDEVSSHYDPMIAKLIVQGPDRETAIRKLHGALEEYEIAGPITNVESLKRICQIPAFIAGEVETGFIPKRRQELFGERQIQPELYAQAALGLFFAEARESYDAGVLFRGAKSGFLSTSSKRSFRLAPIVSGQIGETSDTTVDFEQIGPGVFTVSVNGRIFESIASEIDNHTHRVISYFPHTRLETRFIKHNGDITLFQQGRQYRLRCASPAWMDQALGIKDTAHSVLAPMPCKILRVEVEKGQQVRKEQVLVVIESMKMETSIRSPQNGVISKVVHREGVSGNRVTMKQ